MMDTAMNTGELNFDYIPQPDELIWTGEPVRIKANCKSGAFRLAATDKLIGEVLEVDLLAAKLYKQTDFFELGVQDWVQLILVNDKRQIVSMLIKTRSLSAFMALYSDAMADGESLLLKRLKLSFQKHSSEKGEYYSVNFEVVGNSQLIEPKRAFLGDVKSTMLYLVRPDDNPDENGVNGKAKIYPSEADEVIN